jgi:hypothetical protein
MRVFRSAVVALCLAAATAACSSSGDTGSSGGWRVSAAHIRTISPALSCPTTAPVLDTFMSTPTPNPNCSTPPQHLAETPTPQPSAAVVSQWHTINTQQYHRTSAQQWRPIYTTYTAPPGAGIDVQMVHATNQPMPTPYGTTTTAPPASTPLAAPSTYAAPAATP